MPCTVIQIIPFPVKNPLVYYSRIEMTGIYYTLENVAVLSKMLDVVFAHILPEIMLSTYRAENVLD